MTRHIISQAELFPICSRLLDEARLPIHYRSLTQQAVARLGYREADLDMFRAAEDVREKMLGAHRYETFYVGSPLCVGAKRHWFKSPQLTLLQLDHVVIRGNAQSGATGAFESLMRVNSMIRKHVTSDERRNLGLANGQVIEHHVSDWFKEQWPDFYLEPDNKGQWERPCSHDFKLRIGNQVLEVDVTGPRLRGGLYGNPGGGKKSVDLHLLCRISGKDVVWEGVRTGRLYRQTVTPETSLSPLRMVVWLNCHKAGLDYSAIAQIAYGVAA